MNKKVKMLVFSVSPKDQVKIDVNLELAAILGSVNDEHFTVVLASGTEISDFQRALLVHKPVIFHFSGHASSGEIFFENNEKKSKPVQKSALVNWFSNLTEKPRIIFLNACLTADNMELLSEHVDFVITTRRDVYDLVAIPFAAKFYECLSRRENVGAAFNLAKHHFEQTDMKDAAEMYELFVRKGADPQEIFIADADRSNEKPYGGLHLNMRDIYSEKVNIAEVVNQTNYESVGATPDEVRRKKDEPGSKNEI